MQFESKEQLAAYFWENPGLQTLDLRNCPDLTTLPALPSTLIMLRVFDCSGLTSLPALPSSLTILSVINCPSLPNHGLRVGNLTVEIR